MDIEKIKKERPKIAAAVVLITLGIIFIPPLFRDKSRIGGSGTVEVTEVDVASRVNARVVKILADEGSAVKKGQILAQLDDSVVSAQKEAAAVVLSNALKNYERARNLSGESMISDAAFEQAQSAYISAKAVYAQAKTLYEDAKVSAPWDGFILERHAEEGELMSPNAPLFTIGDLSKVKVTIYLPLKEMTMMKYGMRAAVTVDAFKDRKFEGSITYISGGAEFTPKNVQTKDERVKEVFKVQVTVPNPDYILKPGVPADVVLKVENK
jgi:HlyD family secretion protein